MSDSHATPPAEESATQGKSGLLPKLLIGVFVALVVAVECAAAYFLLPTPEEVSAKGGEASAEHGSDAVEAAGGHADEHPKDESHGDKQKVDSHSGHDSGHGSGGHGDEHGERGQLAEVELGEFSITLLQPEAGMAYRVDFKIGATVGEHEKEKFTELFAACQQRFRDQVMIEVRNCEIGDLTDSGLGLIKRRISEKSNALFGEPLLQGVFFSEFSLVEQ